MRKTFSVGSIIILSLSFVIGPAVAQDRKLDKIRTGGGSTSATQMSMWLAKEGGFYEKHGLGVEAISIPGSSLASCRSFSSAARRRSKLISQGRTRSSSRQL